MIDDKHDVKRKPSDPAPSAVDISHERVRRLSEDMAVQSLTELRELREQIDDVMRAITARRDDIAERIQRQADLSTNVAALKSIIVENLTKLKLQIAEEPHDITPAEVRKRINLPLPEASTLK